MIRNDTEKKRDKKRCDTSKKSKFNKKKKNRLTSI